MGHINMPVNKHIHVAMEDIHIFLLSHSDCFSPIGCNAHVGKLSETNSHFLFVAMLKGYIAYWS